MNRHSLRALASRLFALDERDVPPAFLGALSFFLLFAGYFLLRPVRETMGIAGGVKNLQWLFTATFVATLIALPLFGWLAARAQRDRIAGFTIAFFAVNLLMFASSFAIDPGDVTVARAFYVWLSVFSLLAVSVVWSLLADLFDVEAAKRLFALMASGASLGGLAGPMLGLLLVEPLGHAGLLVVAALLLGATILVLNRLIGWRKRFPLVVVAGQSAARTLGGSPVEGAALILRSPLLIGCATFVVLLASTTTFLYFEQARIVQAHYPNPSDQTRVFAAIDTVVQILAIAAQVFVTGKLARRLGVGILLVAIPLVVAGGFVWLAVSPALETFVVVMIIRRAGEYAFVRPGREMLFTRVSPSEKYKAKSFIDTVVYRGADAVSGWLKAAIDSLATVPMIAPIAGCAIALAWAFNGAFLSRAARIAPPVPDPRTLAVRATP